MGMIPKTTKTEAKALFNMSMKRLMGAMWTLMAAFLIGRTFVYPSLNLFFIIVCVGIYFLLNISAPGNPQKRLWQGLILFLKDRMSPRYYLSVIGYAYSQYKGGDIVVQDPTSEAPAAASQEQEDPGDA